MAGTTEGRGLGSERARRDRSETREWRGGGVGEREGWGGAMARTAKRTG